MARLRRHSRPTADIWPGFVDALSTLLLVSIFLLSVFVLAQFFLSQLLEGRDARLLRLQDELDTSEQSLASERLRVDELRRSLARLNSELGLARSERDAAESELARALDQRDTLQLRLQRLSEQNTLLQQTLADTRLDADTGADERRALEQGLRAAEATIETDRATIAAQLDDLARLESEVATLTTLRDRLEGRIAEQAATLARLEETARTQEETLRDIDASRQALRAELGEVRDRALALEAELAEASERTLAAQRAMTDAEAALAWTEASMAALTDELRATRDQLARIEAILAEREVEIASQELRIEDLDTRLAAALAQEVDELQRFRSEFFGRLREVLGDRADVRVVGDRFVFQSEVLFERASATLGPAARAELRQLAATLNEITADLPRDLPWILQVNGHTDRRPIRTPQFPSNWELSTARAISVARFLIDQGIPPERVAAAGFGEFQPVDPGTSEAAYAKNRRIEIKLTTR